MTASHELYVRPISWSIESSSSSPRIYPSIQIFGYTSDHQSIYIRIPRNSTFILKFDQTIDDELIANIHQILSPIQIEVSPSNSSIMIVRGPEISPLDLSQDDEKIVTWQSCQQDPYGELESFWAIKQIKPYHWLRISNYQPLARKYTTSDFNIQTFENDISSIESLPISIIPRLFFWDIETFTPRKDEFPNAMIAGDYIFMISIITSSQHGLHNYVLVKTNLTTEVLTPLLQSRYPDVSVGLIVVSTEAELLDRFFDLYRMFQPDRHIYYNGDMYDMPYLIERLDFHQKKIPSISKIPTLELASSYQKVETPFGAIATPTIDIPGTETIDLLYFYRRFYPYLRNHQLDTISNHFLGIGKTDVSIEQMREAVSTDHPEKLTNVIGYSYVDSLRMQQLWERTQVDQKLDRICNQLRISTSTLLHESYDRILDSAMYNIDHGSFFAFGISESPSFLRSPKPGIYHQIYRYDYSELYRYLLLESTQTNIVELAHRLKDAPPVLIMKAFYSKHVDRTRLHPILLTHIEQIKRTNSVIAIEDTILLTIAPLDFPYLQLVNRFNCYVSLAAKSYITLDDQNQLQTFGTAKICRPPCELHLDVITQYIQRVCSNTIDQFVPPDYTNLPLTKFILVEKIEHIQNYAPSSLKYELAKQQGGDILTWVKVKYVMTVRGPSLVSLLGPEDILDYNYYIQMINTDLARLNTMKNYKPH